MCNKALNRIKIISEELKAVINDNESFKLLDIKIRFELITEYWFSFLDNSIKQNLTKRNIKITGDLYAGFDTEYVPIE
jgi:hypothetical protein